ncbi:MAG: hypothetical protein KIT36_06795 [Alphaproteobacteria bacterium]|nr:hypothetical protein [Alphaproteobacteria bacterium]
MLGKWLRRRNERCAHDYLDGVGVLTLLRGGNAGEIPPVLYDLYNLHRQVRSRRPRTILEFGVGFSTIVLAHAMDMNLRERPQAEPAKAKGAPPPAHQLWSVDANAAWIENARGKVPEPLRRLVTFHHSDVQAIELAGQLCHRYTKLPNIVPDFVYLDGPDPGDVKGEVNGLSFTLAHGGPRQVVAADIVLMEPSLRAGFFMILDARFNNMHFLRHNLRRRYRVRVDRVNRLSTFELLERTGRH